MARPHRLPGSLGTPIATLRTTPSRPNFRYHSSPRTRSRLHHRPHPGPLQPPRQIPLPHPVIEINRGGQATYHGPGQLVGYPILDLTGFGRDLHRYLRALELALIAACSAHGIKAALRDGLTGVWVEERKIASIGVGVRRWITMHGFAINVRNNLAGFDNIIPCGLENVSMTSLEQETGSTMSVAAFANELRPCLLAELESLRSPAP
jgi:lipoyl(octanoyl) transferase